MIQETKELLEKVKAETNTMKYNEDCLMQSLAQIFRERQVYQNILYEMRKVSKENVWIFFKTFINDRHYGWEQVKDNIQEYEIPHELNERIFQLVQEYYSTKVRELDEFTKRAINRYVEENLQEPDKPAQESESAKHL